MGNESSKPKKPLLKFDIEISCDQIYHHLLIQRDRKINELATRERELRDKIKKKTRSYEETAMEISSLVNTFKYIKATKIVMRYCQVLKEHSIQIVEACNSKNYKNVRELIPYFEGLVWSTDKLNLSYIKEFNKLITAYFGVEIFKQMTNFHYVDKELADCFGSIEPSPWELQDYLIKFLARYDVNNFVWPQGMVFTPAPNTQTTPAPYPPHGGQGGYPVQNVIPQSTPQTQPMPNYPSFDQEGLAKKPSLDDETINDVLKSLSNGLNISPNQGNADNNINKPQPVPVPLDMHSSHHKQKTKPVRPMRKIDQGPEAYTDEKDDIGQFEYYEDIPLIARIQEMRNINV